MYPQFYYILLIFHKYTKKNEKINVYSSQNIFYIIYREQKHSFYLKQCCDVHLSWLYPNVQTKKNL